MSCEARKENPARGFESINQGYNSVFQPQRLSLGLVVPLETYPSTPVPKLERHLERVQLAESLGFSAVWLRDVPFNVASFGDAGQLYDPFVYLGLLAGQTQSIALGVASIVLPLRHPLHVAKAAASVDQLSGGRLILGVASGDRPEEYPALNMSYRDRGARFRASFEYMRKVAGPASSFHNTYGSPTPNMELLPKPTAGKIPLLITGGSQQSPDWLATNGDGWMTYPRHPDMQARVIQDWRAKSTSQGCGSKPVMQPLHIDLTDDDSAPQPIHLGFRSGPSALLRHLKKLEACGVNHVAINLRFNQGDPETTMQRLAQEILPEFAD